jgi:hypothetical protein
MQQILANCGNVFNFLKGVESYARKKHFKQHLENAYDTKAITHFQHGKITSYNTPSIDATHNSCVVENKQ